MEQICAGIVLYNPEIELLEENIKKIEKKVKELYLYDNGSSNIDLIISMFDKFDNIIIEKGLVNRGIAYGLNKILSYAKQNKYNWVLTLDQDSICSDNLIEEYLKYINIEKLAMICPFVLNNNKFSLEEYKKLNLLEAEYINDAINCITSGCLCNVKILIELGGFNTNYFIDYVDTEINCRVLKSGYKILRANRSYLSQSMGSAKEVPVFIFLYKLTKLDIFRRMKIATVYNDTRLYYEARNSYATYKKYKHASWRLSPIFMFLLFLYFSLVYPQNRSRIKMWKSIIKGFCDSKELMM